VEDQKIKVFAPVSRDTHRHLKNMAQDRGVTLYRLAAEILKWAGDKDVTDLIRLGVRLPVYPGELERRPDHEDNQ